MKRLPRSHALRVAVAPITSVSFVLVMNRFVKAQEYGSININKHISPRAHIRSSARVHVLVPRAVSSSVGGLTRVPVSRRAPSWCVQSHVKLLPLPLQATGVTSRGAEATSTVGKLHVYISVLTMWRRDVGTSGEACPLLHPVVRVCACV